MNSILKLTPSQRSELYTGASQKIGIGEVILEKDFWVCWTLQQLFTLPDIGEHLIFKGGTSLSKVWKAISRFSEDIDISFSREWLGFVGEQDPENAKTGKKQRERIEALASECSKRVETVLLPALNERCRTVLGPTGWAITIDPLDAQTLRITYPTALGLQSADAYVRREVKIECGARSDDWPAEEKTIAPYVAELFPEAITDAVVPVHVLSIERTFWEKATILHAEAHRDPSKATPIRFSRHYADLAALANHPSAASALAKDELRARVVEHKRVFFPAAWAKYETAVPGSFRLVPQEHRLITLEADYRAMGEMFFGKPLSWKDILAELTALENSINHIKYS